MALGARAPSSAHALARKQFRPATLPALRMAGAEDKVIDFGKVGFSDAENQVLSPSVLQDPSVVCVPREHPTFGMHR